MKKKLVALIFVAIFLAVSAKADYEGITTTALNFRDNNGNKIDVVPEGEKVLVKGKFNDARVTIVWGEKEGNVLNRIIEITPKAITMSEIKQNDSNGNFIQSIPKGKVITVKEKNTDDEKVLVEYDGKIGTVLASEIETNFIHVNIENQRISMYLESNFLVGGPVVTGTANTKRATPKGIFSIQYKDTDAILRGRGYASYVKYWMPIYGGIGIHDADGWRSQYGGDIYKTSGSHGCINVQRKVVKTIYENAYKGMIVVVD